MPSLNASTHEEQVKVALDDQSMILVRIEMIGTYNSKPRED